MSNLLLEIGVEEVPARFVPGGLKDLQRLLTAELDGKAIEYDEISTFGSPRRLAIILSGISGQQKDTVKEVFGPPKKIAFNDAGNPTEAARKFASSLGIEAQNLEVRTKGKGEYVCAVISEKGRPTAEVLPEILKKVVTTLQFPKSMRWAEGEMRFVRPMHWIVALLDREPVEFEVEGIKSGTQSRGHRFLCPVDINIPDPFDYEGLLEDARVMASPKRRMESISEQINEEASEIGATVVKDPELLRHVVNLVEYPVAMRGQFPKEYLKLPEELLIIVMRDHQKYFALRGQDGKLTNSFVLISNTTAENTETVTAGAERVIKARFEDARFYFEEDTSVTLQSRIDELKKVTFHDKIGSLYEKTMRVAALAEKTASYLTTAEPDKARRAAMLSKCDLIAGAVREFPELQGVMGRYYAINDNEAPEVAEAIMEQYLPAFSGDSTPESPLGQVLALSDRMDNIAAFYKIGLRPSGSEDPFALRRQALGVISILREHQMPLTIETLLKDALSGLQAVDGPDPTENIYEFFRQRFDHMLPEEGYGHDLVDAVRATLVLKPISDALKRLKALKAFTQKPESEPFLSAFKRVRNIVPEDTDLPPLSEALFNTNEEKTLHKSLASLDVDAKLSGPSPDYASALDELLTLSKPINDFFEKVMVMDKDEKVKLNRLALLKLLWTEAAKVADISKLNLP